jgi:mono/diheme cytochrome c family protein
MKKALKIVLAMLAVLVLAGGAFYAWATMRVNSLRSREIATHTVDFPIPFPLTEAEIAELSSPDSADALALARAIERGRHLVDSRYLCTECHGANFGGGTMIDDPALGRMLGPNITQGRGSAVAAYSPSDWDRAVRHGIAPSGMPLVMPAEDFQLMSDQELADIISYIRSMPPVDNEVVTVDLGPVGTVLVALGQLRFAADVVPAHTTAHIETPPANEVTTELGRHLAGVCTGCHKADLSGGPVPGGDPSWPPARNLTPHADGLAGWSYDDFTRAMRDARRPDGTDLLEPMSMITNFTRNMSDTELQALWLYVQGLPAVATVE